MQQKEIDQEKLLAIRAELKKQQRAILFLIFPDPPPAKIGKPIQRALVKVGEALTLLGEPEE